MKTPRVTPEWEESLMTESVSAITTEEVEYSDGKKALRIAVNGYGVMHLQTRDPLVAAIVVHGLKRMLDITSEHAVLLETAEEISEGFMEMTADNPFPF